MGCERAKEEKGFGPDKREAGVIKWQIQFWRKNREEEMRSSSFGPA